MSHPPTINATMMTKTMLMTMSCSSKIRDWLTGLAVAVNRFIMGPQLITSDLSLCRSDHLLIINTWSADKTRASSPIGGSSAMTSEIRDKLTGRSIALCNETLTDQWSLILFSWRSDYRHLQWITVDHKHPVSWFVIIIWYNTSFSQLRCVWSSDHCLIFISFKAEV